VCANVFLGRVSDLEGENHVVIGILLVFWGSEKAGSEVMMGKVS